MFAGPFEFRPKGKDYHYGRKDTRKMEKKTFRSKHAQSKSETDSNVQIL